MDNERFAPIHRHWPLSVCAARCDHLNHAHHPRTGSPISKTTTTTTDLEPAERTLNKLVSAVWWRRRLWAHMENTAAAPHPRRVT